MREMPDRGHRTPIILVTGRNGQVGFELRRSLGPLGHVVALDRAGCDLSRPDDIRRAMLQHRPDVIVNAAAYTSMDKAETDAERAFAVNATAVGILAEQARELGSLLVHYSSDCVFDGSQATPYVETDTANPISVYGRSKLAGEQAIAATGLSTLLIFRTSWVAGAHGNNFAKAILGRAREGESLRVVADRFGAPTSAALLADVTAQIIAGHWLHGERDAFAAGTYHLAGAGETSWYGYATEVLRYAVARGAILKTGPEAIEALTASEYPLPAPRPTNARLDCAKLRRVFDIHLPGWRDGVHHLLEQILA